ncbi:DUF3772 domain-containing protein [Xylophilus sp.]|uniref:DUF3772 domain-containing protein n=1 Tax=Xylophilus sp. TaxID=2653893 RepID=UPI0013B9AE0B|nr:DUF3772 domain-containing protein [Xylophilus sp.]KAF1047946.1 MAG: Miniconductance mechanosensitive channel MscM [Xylophilus sp.]
MTRGSPPAFVPWRWLLAAGLLALFLGLVAPPAAQAAEPATAAAAAAAGAPAPSVDALRTRLDAIPAALGPEDDGRKRVAEINEIGTAAEALVASRTAELADIDRRLEGLGAAPAKGAPPEAADVAEQRTLLTRQRGTVDADLKLARLVAVDAEQRSAEVVQQRRQQFRDQVFGRVGSPLGTAFWRGVAGASASDAERLRDLGADAAGAVQAAMAPGRRAGFLASLAGALLLLVAGSWLAERALVRLAPARLPAGRLRRSLLALAIVLVNVAIAGASAQLALSGLDAGDALDDRLRGLGTALVRIVLFVAFASGLGRALLSHRRGSWRLPPLSDERAARLAPYPWALAAAAGLGALLSEINSAAGASLQAEVAAQAASALLFAAVAAAALRQMRAVPPAAAQADGAPPPEPPARPVWVGIAVVLAGAATVALAVSVLSGFIALGGMIARQLVWSATVAGTAYLLVQLADDASEALLSSKGSFGQRLNGGLGIDAGLLDQLAVLAAGAVRLVVLFYMVVALLAPFGTGPDEVFRRGSTLEATLRVGSVTLEPAAVLGAVAVLAVGWLAIRLFKNWLSDRYFPHTRLEPGVRTSIVTLLGYAGGVAVVALALAALGISVERIAWVASALSVGIGFGLQAIVQNFISGLILLVERPVKSGDWVVLGDTEGDVRRINVRATEIQLGDSSTVIVPNSEFITKTVRNMTLSGARGRVLMRLPAPLDTDAQRMREIILAAFADHALVLTTPAPLVQLEGIQSGTLTFLAIGYVDSPRAAGAVRGDLLFTILERLREAGLALSPPATTAVPGWRPAGPTVPASAADGAPTAPPA